MTKLYVLFVLAAIMLSACTLTEQVVDTNEEILIGVSVPLTGNAAYFGAETQKGIAIALSTYPQEIQDTIILEWQDDTCSGTGAITAAQHLTRQDIKYVLGPLCNAASEPSAPIYDTAKTIVIHLGMANEAIKQMPENHITTFPAVSDAMQTLAQTAYTNGNRRMSIIFLQDAFGAENKDTFTHAFEKLGGQILSVEGFTAEESNVRSQLTRIKQQDPDAILIAAYGPVLSGLLKDLEELDMTHINRYSINAFETRPVLEQPVAEGVIYPQPESAEDTPEKILFKQQYTERYGGLPGVYSANAQDALTLLIDSIIICNNNPACVKQKLHNTTNYPGANGRFSIVNGVGQYEHIMLKTVRNGEFVPLTP